PSGGGDTRAPRLPRGADDGAALRVRTRRARRIAGPSWSVRAQPSVMAGIPVIVVVVMAGPGRADDLPGDVVAVLRRVEHAPAVPERLRPLRPEQAVRRRIAVGDVDARELVVAVVL